MTYKELNQLLIPSAETLCARLLPGGKRKGREWIAGSVEGEAGGSLHVVLEGAKAGRWTDFEADQHGDLLALIMATQKKDIKAAADYAREWLNLPAWAPTGQPPFNPLRFGFRRKGEAEVRYPSAAWTYRNAEGQPVAWTALFRGEDGKKDVMPIRIIDGKPRWKGWTNGEKRPLYNLDRLQARPDAPVIVVEGEKTADAAQRLFPDFVAVTWMGGAANVRKADWTPVIDRKTPKVAWADADEPGRKAMAYVAQLVPGMKRVSTTGLPEKWDLADELPDGVDPRAMVDLALVADPVAEAMAKQQAEQEAKDGKERYHLPPGCELSAVEMELLKYGVFEFGNKVWTIIGERGQRGKWATEVSNCTVMVHQHIITKDGALALVTLRNQVDSEAVTMDVPFDQLSTSLSFVKLLANRGNFQWYGTDSAFTAYRRLLMDRMGKGRIITELGTQPEGFYVFANAMVNSAAHPLDRHGCFTYEGASYYVPSGNSFYLGDAEEFSVQKRMQLSSGSVTWGHWCAQMVRCYQEHAYLAITFAVASAFSCYIHSRLDGFPLLFLHGPGGSGKDQLIKFAQGLFGKPQPEIFLSGPNTDKGMIKMFAEFNDLPLNLAEYRNGLKKDMDELLKSLWGRIGYRLAAMRGKRTETIPIRCSAFVSGNDYPNRDNALMRRLIVDEMEKVPRTTEDVEEYRKLQNMARDGYSHLLVDVLKHRQAFEAAFMDHFGAARGIILEALNETEVDDAILGNLQTLIAVRRFFEPHLAWAFTTDQLAGYLATVTRTQLAKRSEGSEVANFWTCFIHAARSGKLVQDRDFRIQGQSLHFFWGSVYPAYAEAHQRIFGERAERTSDMRAKLERHPCYLDAAKSTRIGGRNSSAVMVDVTKTGTNLVQLLTMTGQEDLATSDDLPF